MTTVSRNRDLSLAQWWHAGGQTIRGFIRHDILDRAATLTFFSLLTAAPATLAIYSIATLFLANNREMVADFARELVERYLPAGLRANAMEFITLVMGSARGGTIAFTVSVLFALWSSSSYVRAFGRSANAIFDQEEARPLWKIWLTMWGSTLVLLSGTVLILAGLLLNEAAVKTLLTPIARPLGLENTLDFLLNVVLPVWSIAKWPAVIAGGWILITLLYQVAPDVRVHHIRWFSAGAAVALVGAMLVWGVFSLYINAVGTFGVYGALSVLISFFFMTWCMNIAFLIGVNLDAELQNQHEAEVDADD